MILLVAGLLAFATFHVLPAFPSAKAALKSRIGDRLYGPAFGALSILAIVLIVWGWKLTDFHPVYEPPRWGTAANFVLTAIAFLCLGIYLCRGKMRQALRFPLAVGVLLWASGHLLANGDRASLVLFGGFLLYAVVFLAAGWLNNVRPSADVRSGHDMFSVFIGLALYGIVTQMHPLISGVPVLVLSR